MASSFFNATCPLSKAEIDRANVEKPIVGNVTFQHLMWYIGCGFTILTVVLGSLLAITHLSCYVRPREQRQIIRIIFYPIVFCLFSCFSIYSYPDSLYFLPSQGLYEPIALAALFFLFVEFAAPNTETRERSFSELEHRKQKGGGGRFSRFKRNKGWDVVEGGSLRWYQGKYVALYFYFVTTIIIHTVELITQATGRFCQTSFSPAFAHIWVVVISNIVLPIGVIAIIQFYARMRLEPHFKAHSPTAKLLSFKAVLLLNFVQDIIFEILTGQGVFKNTPTHTERDLSIGMPQLLVCFEQAAVMILFQWTLKAAPYREIRDTSRDQPMNIFLAAADALNPTDLIVGAAYAFRLLLAGVGPRGNGSWRRSGGYEKMRDATGVQLHGVTSYSRSSEALSRPPSYLASAEDASGPPSRYKYAQYGYGNAQYAEDRVPLAQDVQYGYTDPRDVVDQRLRVPENIQSNPYRYESPRGSEDGDAPAVPFSPVNNNNNNSDSHTSYGA